MNANSNFWKKILEISHFSANLNYKSITFCSSWVYLNLRSPFFVNEPEQKNRTSYARDIESFIWNKVIKDQPSNKHSGMGWYSRNSTEHGRSIGLLRKRAFWAIHQRQSDKISTKIKDWLRENRWYILRLSKKSYGRDF